MGFYVKTPMKDDYFSLLELCAIGIFNYKIIRVIWINSILIQLITYLVEIHFYFQEPAYFLKFAPFLFSTTYGLAAAVAILWKQSIVTSLWDNLERWSVDNAGQELQSKARKIIRFLNALFVVVLVLMWFNTTLYLFPTKTDVKRSLIMHLFDEWNPELSPWFILIIKLNLCPIYYSMLVHPLLLAYVSQHVILQGHMWVENLQNIAVDYQYERHLNLNQQYQQDIHSRLCFCVARHVHFMKLHSKCVNKLVKPLFVILAIFGFIIGICISFMIYQIRINSDAQNDWQSKIISSIFTLLTAILFSGLIYGGQAIQTMTENVYDEVIQMNWHTFDKRNRMALLIVMENSAQPLRLNFTIKFAINYDLGVRMARALYSVISLIMTINLAVNLRD